MLDGQEPEVAEAVETPETVETVEETPVEQPEGGPETPEVAADVEVVDEVKEGEEVETTPEEPTVELITFDEADELPVVLEKADQIIKKYDLSETPELQSLIDTLKAKVNEPTDSFKEYADYGTPDEIKTLLDRQVLLDIPRAAEDGSGFRPNTDKFAEQLHKTDPIKSGWLYYDLGAQPSGKYDGVTQFEEGIVDLFQKPGESPASVLDRYSKTVEFMRAGVVPTIDAPDFVPADVREAYLKLSQDERETLALLDPDDADDKAAIASKLSTLRLIQNGINGDKAEAIRVAKEKAAIQQEFNDEVVGTQLKFYDKTSDLFLDDLMKTVKFSEDAKIQTLEAHRSLALLTQAFEDSSSGNRARQILNDSGIKFDHNKAKQLVSDIEAASVMLVSAQKAKGPDGKVLDQIALNKAASQFKTTTGEWQKFAKDILNQEAALASTGKAEEVKAEVAKIKPALKARPATNGVGTAAKKETALVNPHPYGSPEYDKWWARKTLDEQRQKAQAYQ